MNPNEGTSMFWLLIISITTVFVNSRSFGSKYFLIETLEDSTGRGNYVFVSALKSIRKTTMKLYYDRPIEP